MLLPVESQVWGFSRATSGACLCRVDLFLTWCVCTLLQVIASGFWAPENDYGRRIQFSAGVFLTLLQQDQKQKTHDKLPPELLQLLLGFVTETRDKRLELADDAEVAAGGKPASTGVPKNSSLKRLSKAVGSSLARSSSTAPPAPPSSLLAAAVTPTGSGVPVEFSDRFPLLTGAKDYSEPPSFLERLESRIDLLAANASASGLGISQHGVTAVQRGVDTLGVEDWQPSRTDWLRATCVPLRDADAAGSVHHPLDLDSAKILHGAGLSTQTESISVASVAFGGDTDCINIEVMETAFQLLQRLVGGDAVVAGATALTVVLKNYFQLVQPTNLPESGWPTPFEGIDSPDKVDALVETLWGTNGSGIRRIFITAASLNLRFLPPGFPPRKCLAPG